jgi:hypothetical protein
MSAFPGYFNTAVFLSDEELKKLADLVAEFYIDLAKTKKVKMGHVEIVKAVQRFYWHSDCREYIFSKIYENVHPDSKF